MPVSLSRSPSVEPKPRSMMNTVISSAATSAVPAMVSVAVNATAALPIPTRPWARPERRG